MYEPDTEALSTLGLEATESGEDWRPQDYYPPVCECGVNCGDSGWEGVRDWGDGCDELEKEKKKEKKKEKEGEECVEEVGEEAREVEGEGGEEGEKDGEEEKPEDMNEDWINTEDEEEVRANFWEELGKIWDAEKAGVWDDDGDIVEKNTTSGGFHW